MNSKLAFYRKYRPNSFLEIIGQEFIVKTLQNSILQNKFSHAYIFSGPRGVGKTSIAKIFSKALNCLNSKNGDCCNECRNCLLIINSQTTDIIELDAASNNGVNEVRNIIDTIGYVPNTLKTKVYIIDEAHMLSNAAWNAFLKSIEEPPKYLVFIFATTEPHKFPLTIISRCQRYNFLKLNKLELKNRLKDISKFEKISIDEKALDKLVALSDGSLRDACSLLDQLDSYSNSDISLEDVNKVFGLIDIQEKLNLIINIVTTNTESLIKQIDYFENIGVDFCQLTYELIDILYDKIIFMRTNEISLLKTLPQININFIDIDVEKLIEFLKIWQSNLTNIKTAVNQRFFFQLTCFETYKLFLDKTSKPHMPTFINNSVGQNDNEKIEQEVKKIEIDEKNSKKINNDDNHKFVLLEDVLNVVQVSEKSIEDITDNSKIRDEINSQQQPIVENKKNIHSISEFDSLIDNILDLSIKCEQISIDELRKTFNPNSNLIDDKKSKSDKNDFNLFDISEDENTITKNSNILKPVEISEIEKIKKNSRTTLKLAKNNDDQFIVKQIVFNNNLDQKKKIDEIFKDIKKTTATNLIEATIKDLKKIVAVSNNGILFLANDKINAQTLNSLSEEKETVEFIKWKFSKIYKIVAITKKELDDFVKNNNCQIKKGTIPDVDLTKLGEMINKKVLAKDIADEILGNIIDEE